MINKLKNHLAGLAIVSLIGGAGIANASLGDMKFYAGAGFDYNSYSKSDAFKQHVNKIKAKGFGLAVPVVGVKFHQNVGVEAGYSFNKAFKINETNDSKTTDAKTKVRNMYLDLMGYMPVANNIELIGGLGIGKLKVKNTDLKVTENNNTTPINVQFKNKANWRLKLGAQYNFSENIAMRAIALYQQVGNKANIENGGEKKFIKNMKSIGLSAIYKF